MDALIFGTPIPRPSGSEFNTLKSPSNTHMQQDGFIQWNSSMRRFVIMRMKPCTENHWWYPLQKRFMHSMREHFEQFMWENPGEPKSKTEKWNITKRSPHTNHNIDMRWHEMTWDDMSPVGLPVYPHIASDCSCSSVANQRTTAVSPSDVPTSFVHVCSKKSPGQRSGHVWTFPVFLDPLDTSHTVAEWSSEPVVCTRCKLKVLKVMLNHLTLPNDLYRLI